MMERFRWTAAVVAAHKGGQVVGRTRLQKTIKLLQRLGLPTDYAYRNHFYGPYSPELQSDIGLLDDMGLLHEEAVPSPASETGVYYVIKAKEGAQLKELEPFLLPLRKLEEADPVVLELAATYDAFHEMGADHDEALSRLRRKKGAKCEQGREGKALGLLREIGLPAG